ncbi:MAG: hypothetical protein KA604_00130 [Candidatus Saccharimonas sp.]|nr:hypothetical protein [Candidatus Saccharimonas sp.]
MTHLAVDVVKRGGKRPTESFDQEKLYRSIHAACLSVRAADGHAHDTASKVCDVVITWSADKPEITSSDVRRRAAKALERLHPEAAYIYQHHRVII